MSADLHIHTTASDGQLSPRRVLEAAINAGLSHIAITDHDTLDGFLELSREVDLSVQPLTVIPGIEFSTDLPDHEVHILGYNIDVDHEDLRRQLALIVDDRWERVKQMIAKLDGLGYCIAYERVTALAGNATAVGRPHIARALVEQGYFDNVTTVFHTLLYKNGPAYVPHYKLTLENVLALIAAAGGTAVLAHPGLIGDQAVVHQVMQAGIQGIEAYHPSHHIEETNYYLQLAAQYNLKVTGGSDFHALESRFPVKLGIFAVPAALALELQQ